MKYLILFLTLILFSNFALAEDQLTLLLNKGDIDTARKLILDELASSKTSDNWQGLMRAAWFEDTVSEHRKAIEYSNQALAVATKQKDDFKIGRSLCWLGWAYSRLGLYELALQFFGNAVDLSSDNGEVKIPMVWGLATQEIGAIYFRQGDTQGALTKLLSTYKLAQELGVTAGIAEGSTHLAEIYLGMGDITQAEIYANTALNQESSVGPDIYGKAQVIAAKIWLEKSTLNPEFRIRAIKQIDTTLKYCKQKKLPTCQAEALLLKSQTMAQNEFTDRHKIVAEAFEILANKESELRGFAEAELGRVYLENNKMTLAKFYIDNGIKVSSELFRKIDRAFLNRQLANLAEKNGDANKQKEQLLKSLDAALESNLLPQALDAQIELSKIYEKEGFFSSSLQWNKEAQKTVQKLIEQNLKLEEKQAYQRKLLGLEEAAIFSAIQTKRDYTKQQE